MCYKKPHYAVSATVLNPPKQVGALLVTLRFPKKGHACHNQSTSSLIRYVGSKHIGILRTLQGFLTMNFLLLY